MIEHPAGFIAESIRNNITMLSDSAYFLACITTLAIMSIGTYTDIKKREVADYVNFFLLFSALGLHLLVALQKSNIIFFIDSLIGLLVFFIIANIMFYTGQWGGGDSKMIMGIGAMLGAGVLEYSIKYGFTGSLGSLRKISSSFSGYLSIIAKDPPAIVSFLIYTIAAGALYGLAWAIVMTIKSRKKTAEEIKNILKSKSIKKAKSIILIFSSVLMAIALVDYATSRNLLVGFSFSFLAVASVTIFYFYVFAKAVEKTAMIKMVSPDELTEGDWIAEDIYINKKYITGPKDLGISIEQIEKLKKGYKKKVKVKTGIPFVPSFLAAFVLVVIFGNSLYMVFF